MYSEYGVFMKSSRKPSLTRIEAQFSIAVSAWLIVAARYDLLQAAQARSFNYRCGDHWLGLRFGVPCGQSNSKVS